jgi:hypothetical protein
MNDKTTMRRAMVILGVAVLLVLGSVAGPVEAGGRSRGAGLTGTWFVSLPNGLTGFYTYHHGGTLTGTVSNIFGAPPQASAPLFTTAGPDHGLWRRTGRGYQASIYRMTFDPDTGDPLSMIRIRMDFSLDSCNTASGTFTVDVWFCPDALSCPDPNTTRPDIEANAPPPPFDTFTQTRMRMP